MNILVISYSTIVMELLNLVFKDGNIQSEHAKLSDEAKNDSYDVIFIDDSTPNLVDEIENIKDNFSYSKLILIGNSVDSTLVDIVVKKPFLPKDIKDILKKINSTTNKENISIKETNVLNYDEIAKIKELMALTEIDEDKLSVIEKLEQNISQKLKGKEAKEFLYECRGLTKKELKKLLKGAKVSIKISYKSRDNE